MMQNKKQVPLIGITGGIGCGKSVVMDILKNDFDAAVIFADLVAHDLMQPGGESYQEIIREFGNEICDGQGAIDREKLSHVVFADKNKLAKLNAITHPLVLEEIRKRIRKASMQEGVSLVAVEAALLLESGIEDIFDQLWYVYADEETRIRRLFLGRNYTEEKSRSVMRKQKNEEEFRAACDLVIDNSGSVEETRVQIQHALERMGVL